MPWTILRFGRLTEEPGNGRIGTAVPPGTPVTSTATTPRWRSSRRSTREHLARQVVHVIDGDRRVADALDAVEPRPLPAVRAARQLGRRAGRPTTRRVDPRHDARRTPRRSTPTSTTRATGRSRPS